MAREPDYSSGQMRTNSPPWTSLTLIFASAQSPFSSHVSVPVMPSKPEVAKKASRSALRGMYVVPPVSYTHLTLPTN